MKTACWTALGAVAVLVACTSAGPGAHAPRLGAARPGPLLSCTDLAAKAARPDTVYTSAVEVPAGAIAVGNTRLAAPAHCLVQGRMNERVSTVDGNSYAIGFEMRLPLAW